MGENNLISVLGYSIFLGPAMRFELCWALKQCDCVVEILKRTFVLLFYSNDLVCSLIFIKIVLLCLVLQFQ